MTISSSKRTAIGKKLKKARTHLERVHVIPQKGKWSVHVEGAERAHKILDSKQGAIDYAKSAVAGRFSPRHLIVHNKDGKIASMITMESDTGRRKPKDSVRGTGRGKK